MIRYDIQATKQYKKDVRRLHRAGFDLHKLESVIDLLASGRRLPHTLNDHPLKGRMKDSRECHIAPDWLLRYMIDGERLILILVSTGDHRRVLGRE